MKRDMDIIRTILLAARETDEPLAGVPGVDPIVFAQHVQLLEEAGLVMAAIMPKESKQPAQKAVLFRLTWDGHDFADSVADNAIWKKAKHYLPPLPPGHFPSLGKL